ncbi:MAG: hypothetical protein AAB776_01985 [Patescibacteria group bacterium]|mgnify:FL=1
MKALFGMAAIASMAAGCNTEPEDVHELQPENKVYINQIVADNVSSQGVVEKLIRSSKHLSDAQGKQGDEEQIVIDSQLTIENLADFHARGRIFQYNSEIGEGTNDGTEELAYFHSSKLKPHTLEESYIALNVKDRDAWYAIVTHEMAHAQADHCKEIEDAVKRDRLPYDQFFALAVEKGDFAYQQGELQLLPAIALHNRRFETESHKTYIRDEVNAGRMSREEAEEAMNSALNIDMDSWLSETVLKAYGEHVGTFSQIDIDVDEALEAMYDERFQERLHEINREARQEIKEVLNELNNERPEARNELNATRNARPLN